MVFGQKSDWPFLSQKFAHEKEEKQRLCDCDRLVPYPAGLAARMGDGLVGLWAVAVAVDNTEADGLP